MQTEIHRSASNMENYVNVHYIKATYPNGDVMHYERNAHIEQITIEEEVTEALIFYTNGAMEVVNLYNMLAYEFLEIEE